MNLPSGQVTTPHVLIHEDITCLLEFIGWPEVLFVLIFTIGSDAVRRTVDHERVALRRIFGHVDRCEQVHAVAHGDAVFVFCVVSLDVVFFGSSGPFLGGCSRGQSAGYETQPEQVNQTGFLHGTSGIR